MQRKTYMKTALSALLAASLLTGCAGRREAYCRYEGPARLGQTVYLKGPSLHVDRLLEDSRCPTDVRCVQAGTVRIRVSVIGGGEPVDLTLGQPLAIAGGRLTLLSVQPPRRTALAPAPEDYRFTFDFSAGQ